LDITSISINIAGFPPMGKIALTTCCRIHSLSNARSTNSLKVDRKSHKNNESVSNTSNKQSESHPRSRTNFTTGHAKQSTFSNARLLRWFRQTNPTSNPGNYRIWGESTRQKCRMWKIWCSQTRLRVLMFSKLILGYLMIALLQICCW